MKLLGTLLVLFLLVVPAFADDNRQSGAQVNVDADKPDGEDVNKEYKKRKHKVKDEDNVDVPFVKVRRAEDGSVHVSAPFTQVDTDEHGRARVQAPFTKVDE